MTETATNFSRVLFEFERKISNQRVFSPQNISLRFSGINTSEPAVNQALIRHNRSLHSLLFRSWLDSRQNPMCKQLLLVLKRENFSFQPLSKSEFCAIFVVR
ncbi:MAG: hypothetical protein J6K17_05885 [Oscillospiraceae bacterium]|nr:hypothetical protein [Clostridia bacterium]MBQ5318604.1 hypothetical protein [Oscillospiraceae bacterium]